MQNTVTTVANIALYNWNLLAVLLKCSHQKKKQFCEMMDVLIN